MNEREVREGLQARFPGLDAYWRGIERVQGLTEGIRGQEFYETKFILDMKGDLGLPFLRRGDLLAATSHMSFGTLTRLFILESAALSELQCGRFMSAMMLIRSHLESACQSAYWLSILHEAEKTGDWSTVGRAAARLLFGDALAKEARYKDEMTLFPRTTIRQTMKAAQEMMGDAKGPDGLVEEVYAMLCNFAHPTSVGMTGHCNRHADFEGAVLQYKDHAQLDTADIEVALKPLWFSMRIGLTAAVLLLASDFSVKTGEDGMPGAVCLKRPAVDIWAGIRAILEEPGPNQGAE